MKTDPQARLYQYSKEEWFDVARVVKPSLTWHEFDRQWEEIMTAKAERERRRAFN